MVRRLLYDVVRSGFTPVIAHPERCPLLEPPAHPNGNGKIRGHLLGGGPRNGHDHRPPDAAENPLLSYLRDLGCSFQGGSFSGFYGGQVMRTAELMRGAGLYNRYGSDLHTPEQAKIVLSGLQKQTVGY
jgi:protein-tyrosine phosphatase